MTRDHHGLATRLYSFCKISLRWLRRWILNAIMADQVSPCLDDDGALYHADSCDALAQAAAEGSVALNALARGQYPGRRLPGAVVPEVRTIGYWDAATAQQWGLDWHRNEGIEITYLAHGSLDFFVDGDRWRLEPGQVTITRPWQRHRVGNPDVGASQLHWLILDVGVRRPHQVWRWPKWLALTEVDIARLTDLLQHNEYGVWPGSAELGRSFERAAELTRRPIGPCFESDIRLAVSGMLLELLKMLEANVTNLDASLSAPRRGVAVFLDDLVDQLQRPWTVTAMAKACGMGRTQFTQHCRELTNSSPMAVLNNLRLSRAAELLTETTFAVTDIAQLCGFSTSQYLATCFKAHYGKSPSDYRDDRRSILTAG